MDREIPKEVRQKERNKKIIRYSSIGVASIIAVSYTHLDVYKRQVQYNAWNSFSYITLFAAYILFVPAFGRFASHFTGCLLYTSR